MSNFLKLPGLIDIHVHLREPYETHKEDFYSGTLAALAGGVTTVFDMPTRTLHMLSEKELNTKIQLAQIKAVCDWGLYFGTDGKNIGEFEKVAGKVVGLKIYLNITTGHTLLSENLLDNVFKSWPKTKVIVIHTEDIKIDTVINLSEKYGNKIHITHCNTRSLLQKILRARKKGLTITCDVTPHHLFLNEEMIKSMKGFGMVKPPIASEEDRKYLWDHLQDIDCIATDHAPHTTEEKKSNSPPSGMPGLETILPLLITSVKEEKLKIDDIIRLTNTNPQKIFGFTQSLDTYVEVDIDEKYTIENKRLKTKCGWSPFAGKEVYGRIQKVFIRGEKVFEKGKILVKPGSGRNIIL